MAQLSHLFTIGQKVRYICSDFDGKTNSPCTITEIHDDHMILHDDLLDINHWIESGYNLNCVYTSF